MDGKWGAWKADLNQSLGRRWRGPWAPGNEWTRIIWGVCTRSGRYNDGEGQPWIEVFEANTRGQMLGTGWTEDGGRKWPGRASRKIAEGFG